MNLIIKTIKGKGDTITLYDINPMIYVKDLKDILEDRTKIPINQQVLVHNGTKLVSYKLLFHYELRNDSIIYLVQINDSIRINVHLVSGGHINLYLSKEELISEVKKTIENRKQDNVTADQQRLAFNGMTLNDNGTLSDYKISNNSTIEVNLRLLGGSDKEIDINNNEKKICNDVKDYMYRKANSWHQKLDSIIIKSNKKEFLIKNIGNFEKISELKKRILQQDIKLVKESVLTFNGQLLKDSMKLFNYQITNNSIIYIDLVSDIQIFIDIEGERNHILININTIKYVHELKKLIQIQLNNFKGYDYYFGEMNLIYEDDETDEDIELDENKILLFYKIKNESIINLFKRPLKIIIISLLNNERKLIYLDCKPNDTIKNLKNQIQIKLELNEYDFLKNLELIYDGKIADDDQTLSNYEINYESKFLIREKNDNKIKIQIKHSNISKITLLEFNSSIITIDEIKRMYQNKERKSVDCQELFCDRKQILENEHLLSEYVNIKDEIIIYLILKC